MRLGVVTADVAGSCVAVAAARRGVCLAFGRRKEGSGFLNVGFTDTYMRLRPYAIS